MELCKPGSTHDSAALVLRTGNYRKIISRGTFLGLSVCSMGWNASSTGPVVLLLLLLLFTLTLAPSFFLGFARSVHMRYLRLLRYNRSMSKERSKQELPASYSYSKKSDKEGHNRILITRLALSGACCSRLSDLANSCRRNLLRLKKLLIWRSNVPHL